VPYACDSTPDDVERFWVKVDRSGPDGCWVWTAARVTGYGRFRLAGKQVGAHRLAYELLVGPIPDGLTIDHLCRNRACVNPSHLEPVTGRVNTLRGFAPPARNATKTHCLAGHPFEGDNLRFTSRVERICRTCRNEHSARRRRELTLAQGGVPGKGQYNAARTHCQRNHEFTPENTYIAPKSGKRVCRQCRRESARARQAKRLKPQ